jgi:sulfite reductase beta subunit-like hemoprotein
MRITSSTDADMEIFLAAVGEYLGKIGAETTIDLYTDFEITDPEPKRLFEQIRQVALGTHTGGRRSDPYMAIPLNLTTDEGITYFSRLAHRTIHCEAVLNNKVIFSTVENERIVFLEIPEQEVEALEAKARQAGATTLSHAA